MSERGVLIVGCGLIGRRRAQSAALHSATKLAAVYDTNAERARELASDFKCAPASSWEAAINDPHVEIVCVATPNAFLAPVAVAALGAGKHVLIEKPMGRNLQEAGQISEAALRARRVLRVGFNHRYHPAIVEAYRRFKAGEIGRLISIRARYGHGGRPGYENEWRGNAELAGGGELIDQGVHVADLVYGLAGLPSEAFAYVQTAVWPLHPLEDNAFALFRFGRTGPVVSMHTSWTQWKNLFSFEIFGETGSLSIEGLGMSYGVERLVIARRAMEGGAPEMTELTYDEPDLSWEREWDAFVKLCERGAWQEGNAADGMAAMTMIDALYRSAAAGNPVAL